MAIYSGPGKVLMLTTLDDPFEAVSDLKSRYSWVQGLLTDYYKLSGNQVTAVLTRVTQPEKQVYRYKRQHRTQDKNETEQLYYVEFTVRDGSRGRQNQQVTWVLYSICSTNANTRSTMQSLGVHTTLAELRVPRETLQDAEVKAKVDEAVRDELSGLQFSPVGPTQHAGDGSMLTFYVGDRHSHAVTHVYADGLVTVDVSEQMTAGQTPMFTEQVMNELTTRLKTKLSASDVKCLPAIRRGEAVQRYFPSTDKCLIEYDFDECVVEADSEYQNIKIMHSSQFGNMLILDDDPNMAESDLSYTQAITGLGREDYRDKTVLVLGGGDGGILHELLKESPKLVIMVDIDGLVVELATKHLRGICYDSLDKLKGDNYEVLIADCVPVLEKYGKEGFMFDYVINDLTAIPCTAEPVGDHWDFLRLILDLSMKVLSPTGKYYTQGNGANMRSALAMYEKQLGILKCPVDFTTRTVCVPSYHEMWVFYEIWKQPQGADTVKT